MFEDIELTITDDKQGDDILHYPTSFRCTSGKYCTRTGCWGTSCKWPC